MSAVPIRIVIVDDHPLVADGVAARLALEPDMVVAGSAGTVDAAAEIIARERPDVVVCDIQVGDRSGFSLLERFAGDQCAFVMFSSHDNATYQRAAIEGGASGYVMKDGSTGQLLAAIRIATRGGSSFPPASIRSLRSIIRPPSDRELQVLERVADGASNDEIAADLELRPKTVEGHLRAMFDRYAVMSRTELTLRAIDEGWIRRRARRARAEDATEPARGAWMADAETLGPLRRDPSTARTGRPADPSVAALGARDGDPRISRAASSSRRSPGP
jgi:DNA-binding NarL/FixJ family response regulator